MTCASPDRGGKCHSIQIHPQPRAFFRAFFFFFLRIFKNLCWFLVFSLASVISVASMVSMVYPSCGWGPICCKKPDPRVACVFISLTLVLSARVFGVISRCPMCLLAFVCLCLYVSYIFKHGSRAAWREYVNITLSDTGCQKIIILALIGSCECKITRPIQQLSITLFICLSIFNSHMSCILVWATPIRLWQQPGANKRNVGVLVAATSQIAASAIFCFHIIFILLFGRLGTRFHGQRT